MRLNLSDREARMSGLQDIKEFLEKQKIAVAGVSRSPDQPGSLIIGELPPGTILP